MASLDKVMESLNIQPPEREKVTKSTSPAIGQKRRAWMDESTDTAPKTKGVYKPHSVKGSIDLIDQPHLSTPLINQVDQPHSVKGSIKGVYKPHLISFENLRGNPLKIAQYIFELMRYQKEKITDKITLSKIMAELEISRDSARTGLRFLLKNNLMARVEFKVGTAGWSRYQLPDELFESLNNAYKKGFIDPLNLKGSNSSSSFSKTNKKTTTTNDEPHLDEWENIDVTPLAHIGLTHQRLEQVKNKNKAAVVQESIYHFSFGLQYNSKTQKYEDPLNVLFGVLNKGGIWIEKDYKSSAEIALEKMLEEKERQKNNEAKLREKILVQNFEEWHQSLSEEEINNFLANRRSEFINLSIETQKIAKRSLLLDYFKTHIADA